MYMKLLLYPFSVIYGFIISVRNLLYDFGFITVVSLSKPVISVGNITMGGTGKTPVVEMLIEYLLNCGKKIAVISRGYKRLSKGPVIVSDGTSLLTTFEEAGDEPFQIANKYPDVIVGVDGNRIRIANMLSEKYKFDLFLLDDGYQHRKVYRDLNILTINAGKSPFKDHIVPAGNRRDELKSIKRADVVLVTRNIYNNFSEISNNVKKLKNISVLPVKYGMKSISNINRQEKDIKSISGKKVILFCGIADPEFFEMQVKSFGAIIVKNYFYSDHHNYTSEDLNKIFETVHDYNAEIILTTEKDFSRISNKLDSIKNFDSRIFYYITIKALPENNAEELYKLIDERVNEKR
jgi:tetraacyldisaccharide 4'-kinase